MLAAKLNRKTSLNDINCDFSVFMLINLYQVAFWYAQTATENHQIFMGGPWPLADDIEQ